MIAAGISIVNDELNTILKSNKALIISKPNFNNADGDIQFLQREYFNINTSSILLKIPYNDLCTNITSTYSDILKVIAAESEYAEAVQERIPYQFNYTVNSKFKLSEITVTFNGSVTHSYTINNNTVNNAALFNNGQIYKLVKNLDDEGHNTFINNIHINYIYTPVEADFEMQYKNS